MLHKKFLLLLIFFPLVYLYGKELKVVSLSPNLTELIFLLKKESTLIGRSSVCSFPADALKIPIVGNLGNPDLEKIISIKPDIIVLTMAKDMSKIHILRNLGIKVYILPTNRISEYLDTVSALGKILNAEETAVKEIVKVKEKITELKKKNLSIPDNKKIKVFWEIWDNPIITAGKNSFLDEYITFAGGKNITGNINRSYFYISKENIISINPDIIIAPCMKTSKIKELETNIGWKRLPAVKSKKVYGNLDPNLVYILGPRMFDAITAIHNCLYPDKQNIPENYK